MSLKEKVREYQKRREAKKYFRSQNQYVIHGKDLPKYIAAIVVASIVIGGIAAYIERVLPIVPMVLYLIIGIAIAEILYRVSGMKSKEMGILAVIACILCYIVKGIVTLLLAGVMITLSNLLSVLFNNSLIGYLFMFAGCYFAYMRSVD